ncbi:hypothetical protein LPJ77_000686 [Coemansia sp. RSA 2523]|nr:hypothetical protein LPJ77_000686 [Coemansia sp. RSA 2523]KAJ2147825.1 hypothetical protein IW142_001386 [Coemansia sp. RSA 564]KAJ2151808.1 hypothetical protein GGH15_006234 [Coemansia sp. RSA 562]KAJ2192553.1 hypothetical protein IW144_004833 [Coemansia sp. RSA 522]KAJ2202650.1 hypothetical protein IW145_004565 [Coemansia sp. RSA 521]KAJ2220718.1 hypothetical protein EV180_004905 [Coemansia sp. RSA 518]KAJ2268560.1 hypothetical protein J3F81_004658 [Coemansia sp. RSA 371]KAJ2286676.1 hy
MENDAVKFFKAPEPGAKISFTKDPNKPGKFIFTMPQPPTFSSFAEERVHRKQRLVAAFRIFAKLGLDEGVGGHLTCRDPEHPELFWVNPFGRSFACITIKDLLLVDHNGTVVVGTSPLNAAAFVIHSKIHGAREDAIAACHSHSVYGKAFSTLAKPVLPVTQDACMFYEDHAVLPGFNGVVADEAEGDRIAEVLGSCKAIVMQNHGLLTVGKTVDEAAFWFIALDKACHVQLLAEAAGTPTLIAHEVAADSHKTVGSSLSGWFNFQPYYQMITREQPDILKVDDEDAQLNLGE